MRESKLKEPRLLVVIEAHGTNGEDIVFDGGKGLLAADSLGTSRMGARRSDEKS